MESKAIIKDFNVSLKQFLIRNVPLISSYYVKKYNMFAYVNVSKILECLIFFHHFCKCLTHTVIMKT